MYAFGFSASTILNLSQPEVYSLAPKSEYSILTRYCSQHEGAPPLTCPAVR